ncbi:WXG100 family type VII secretion target [Specibacter sp. AOP5-B1-6]|uniref:WXG100 family type VII secretion target n=1 Tax=Specibacter sp. AOP5-B1-6 TaxID=3457653 RepID=UPI00402B5FB2
MSGFIGSDPEELRSLAKHMDGGADQLDGLREQLGGRFQSVRWTGADAQRAKGEFRTIHARRIAEAAVMMRDTAELVRKEAREQSTISSGGGAGAGPSGFEIAKALPLIIDTSEMPGFQGAGDGPESSPIEFDVAKALPLIIDTSELYELPDETGGLYKPPIARIIPVEIPVPTAEDAPGREHPVFGPVAEALPGHFNTEDAPDFREPLHTLPDRAIIDDVPELRDQPANLVQPGVYEAFSGPDSE